MTSRKQSQHSRLCSITLRHPRRSRSGLSPKLVAPSAKNPSLLSVGKLHPRAVTCSDGCSHRRTTQRQRAYNSRWNSSERKAATVMVLNADAATPSAVSNETLGKNTKNLVSRLCRLNETPTRAVALVSALTAAGLRVGIEVGRDQVRSVAIVVGHHQQRQVVVCRRYAPQRRVRGRCSVIKKVFERCERRESLRSGRSANRSDFRWFFIGTFITSIPACILFVHGTRREVDRHALHPWGDLHHQPEVRRDS